MSVNVKEIPLESGSNLVNQDTELAQAGSCVSGVGYIGDGSVSCGSLRLDAESLIAAEC